VKQKGNDEYSMKHACEILGYAKIVFKSGQEFALTELEQQVRRKGFGYMQRWQENIKEYCGCQIVLQNSPVGESAANGAMENAVQRVQGQVRAIKLDVEVNAGSKINPRHPVWPWMV